jgi:hypothetical protein
VLVLVVASLLSGAPLAEARTCDVDAPGHVVKRVDEAAPQLVKSTRLGKLLRAQKAMDPEASLDVDERHTRFTMAVDRVAAVTLPLALPLPWAGTVSLVPRGAGRACVATDVVLFDRELRRAELEGLPVEVLVTLGRRGQAPKELPLAQDKLVVTPDTLEVSAGDAPPLRLYLGSGPPDDEVLASDGADRYMKSLAGLSPEMVDDIRKKPSAEAQRVLFAEMAASLRAELGAWKPQRRIEEIARFDEKNMPPDLRPLLHFWKAELGELSRSRKPRTGATARLLVDDAVQALWIDGVEVFDRRKGMPTSVEIRVPLEGVRAWIVGADDVVHDTRAVLKPGEIYTVTSTFVQHVRPAARRECVRVNGELPFHKDIRWREVSGTNTALLDVGETYRPSTPSAERVVTVVPGGDARPFPPVPLIYSYTHPGTYKWTLSGDGGVKLELVEDEAICKP